jgi:hypothetical protein
MASFFSQASGQHALSESEPILEELQEEVRPHTGPQVAESANINIFEQLTTLQVSQYHSFLPTLLSYFNAKLATYQAGSLSTCISVWEKLTSDPEILETVSGQKIEFDTIPLQQRLPTQMKLSHLEESHIDLAIIKLLGKGVLKLSNPEPGEYFSPIFTRPKKDGSQRMILNLKSLNKHVTYHHFKMDSIWSAIRLMKPNCYMASIDLKDAIILCLFTHSIKKYLKFNWKGKQYRFVCFPNGLAICPRKFTKLLKPVYSQLCQNGHISVVFIDDSWLTSDTYATCVDNIRDTVTLLSEVGFYVHPEKSALIPSQTITFLNFLLNSLLMQISLTADKAQKIKQMCQELLANSRPSITMSRVR